MPQGTYHSTVMSIFMTGALLSLIIGIISATEYMKAVEPKRSKYQTDCVISFTSVGLCWLGAIAEHNMHITRRS
jgi:hypothetical protein